MSSSSEPTFGLTPEDLERAVRFVRSVRWQQARTTPGDEHEYSLPAWTRDQREREWFVRLVAERGRRETFTARGPALAGASGSRWAYLRLGDGYRVWCSRVWSAPEDDRRMLNRAKIEPDPQLQLEWDAEMERQEREIDELGEEGQR